MHNIRDGPFDIRGAGIFLKKIVCFPLDAKKNVLKEVENKKFVLHSVNIFEALFSRSYLMFANITEFNMYFFIQCVAFVFLMLMCFFKKIKNLLQFAFEKNNLLCKNREKITCREEKSQPPLDIKWSIPYLHLH